MSARMPPWWRRLAPWGLAAVSGAALALAFAPLQCWPLALVCPALLMGLWEQQPPRRAAGLGLVFGAGTFGAGTWWLYISLHGFGQAPIWLALLLMLLLVGVMAAYHAFIGYAAARWLPASGPWRWFAGLPALWLLVEWWRGWFLSGFPWLSLGYSQTDTWLRGMAPVLGVYGVSALLLLGSGALVALVRGRGRVRIAALALLLLPWPLCWALQWVPWTRPQGAPVSVAILQGAIPQDLKWQAANEGPTRDLYTRLNDEALGAQVIVWPESALPQLANEIAPYLGQLYSRARHHGSDLVMGIQRIDDNGVDVYNSIMAMSQHISFYDKRHLVPFAEYFPVPAFVRNWLRVRNLPYADFTRGRPHQPPLEAGGILLSASICYEDGYGAEVLTRVARAGALVNVTNDAWFGHSSARYQHFQIARMLAIQAQRPLLRAANDGVSALVGPDGAVLARAVEFRPEVLRGTVQPRTGLSAYDRYGNYPIVLLGIAACGLAAGRRLRALRRR